MSTNYTFYLKSNNGANSRQQRKIEQISLLTKGFDAKAIDCGKDTTDVIVETGPNFNGKISAEGHEQSCYIKGDRKSSNTSYLFTIDHKKCGSGVNSTAVWTYVVVQENISILTQSTRRYVFCLCLEIILG